MSWLGPLTALVERCYLRPLVALESIAHYPFHDRVICRVRFSTGPPGLLRAHTGDVTDWFLAQARTLDWLDALGFPAPRVIRTAGGDLIASHDGWTGLMLTFVDGEEAGCAPAQLETIGEYAACLHSLPAGPVGPSRLDPSRTMLARLPLLEAAEDRVPAAARSFHRSALEIVRRLASGDRPPAAMLHGDCYPANAVRAPEGPIVMVDWEGAGRGPAVFEVGYLLLCCHMDRPQLPAMRADPERIAAVVRGYARRRRLTDAELAWLPDAVRYDVVQHAVQAGSFDLGEDRWLEDLWLRKMLARHAVSAEIAEIARACFLRERG
ncbi:MAG TPA: phosphotransferase [Terriglobales bacterium]|nr:phosphotransferase [Terriglobales bacterium]